LSQVLFTNHVQERERERERATSVEGKQQTPLFSLITKCVGGADKRHIRMLFWSSNLKSRFLLAMALFDLLITEMSRIFQAYTANVGV
jgi:hypothetical protein